VTLSGQETWFLKEVDAVIQDRAMNVQNNFEWTRNLKKSTRCKKEAVSQHSSKGQFLEDAIADGTQSTGSFPSFPYFYSN
jgi:hypothetical protein